MAVPLLSSTAAFCDNAVFFQDPECPSGFPPSSEGPLKSSSIQDDCCPSGFDLVAQPSLFYLRESSLSKEESLWTIERPNVQDLSLHLHL